MKEKLKNKKVVYTIIGIVSVLLVALAVTYAYWLVTKTQTGENEITAGCLDITISGEKNDIELTNQFPMSDEDGMKLVPYEFTVTNNCNTSVDYQVALEATGDSSNALKSTSLKVALNDSYKLYSEYSSVDTTISGAYESRVLGYSKLAATGNEGSSDTYSLRIWIDKDAPISEMNKTFTSKISVTIGQGIESALEEGSLAYAILSQAGGVNATSEIDANELDHRITLTPVNLYISTSSNYYYGTDYTYDVLEGKYTLSGTLTQSTLGRCRNGTKTCGKYTLVGGNATDTDTELYEVTDWNNANGTNYVTVNHIEYTNVFGIKTTANDAGLYKTQDDLGDSYYYRGAVTNNYVEFGGITTMYEAYIPADSSNAMFASVVFNSKSNCEATGADTQLWTSCVEYTEDDIYRSGTMEADMEIQGFSTQEICETFSESTCTATTIKKGEVIEPFYWRIVRINGDGTIRLIYDGPTKSQNGTYHKSNVGYSAFNTNYDDAKYVGYTYDDGTGVQVDSTIKGVVDTWYENNLEADYGKYIADSIFCNDREVTSTNESNQYYASYDRLASNKAPSLRCPNQSDRYTVDDTKNGNGLLSNPVGLITADEVAMAGGVSETINSTYYLYNGSLYWTMSPYYWRGGSNNYDAYVWIDSYGRLTDSYVESSERGVRPVINLKADVEFTGDGTIDNPYKIVTE